MEVASWDGEASGCFIAGISGGGLVGAAALVAHLVTSQLEPAVEPSAVLLRRAAV